MANSLVNPFKLGTGRFSPAKTLYDAEFDVERWYEAFKHLTFEVAYAPVDQIEAKALIAAYKHTVLRRTDTCELDDAGLKSLANKIGALFGTINANSFFVRLNTRSPKDAAMDGSQAGAVEAFEEEAARLISELQISQMDDNARLMVLTRVAYRLMEVHTSSVALKLLVQSERVYTDLRRALDCADETQEWSMQVIVRPFTQLDPLREFRGVVASGCLVAVSQYSELYRLPWLTPAVAQRTLELLVCFFNSHVKGVLPPAYQQCVIDFALSTDESRIWVVELNPFGPTSGLKLFEWNHYRRFLQGGKDIYSDLAEWELTYPPADIDTPPECVANAWYDRVVLRYLEVAVPDLATNFLRWLPSEDDRFLRCLGRADECRNIERHGELGYAVSAESRRCCIA